MPLSATYQLELVGAIEPVGIMSASDEVVWFWIGPHEEYEKILYML